MKTTLRQLDRALAELTASHSQVNSYFWGDWVDSFEGRNQTFPAIVCNVTDPKFEQQVTSINLNIICTDQVTKGREILAEVESDTLQILRDYYQALKNGKNWNDLFTITGASVPLKFKDSSPDEVAGWMLTLNLNLAEGSRLCDLPFTYDFTKKINC